MIISTLRRTFSLLPTEQKKRAAHTLGFGLGTAIIDVAGVASVLPFLAVASSPETIKTTKALDAVYVVLGFTSDSGFLIFLGLLSFVILVGGAVMRTVSTYKTNSFIHTNRYVLSSRLFETYLSQPYAFFLGRNTADLSKEIYNEVNIAASQVLSPGLSIIIYGVTVTMMIALLLVVDPAITVVAVLILGLSYWSIYLFVRKRSAAIGKARAIASRDRFEATEAALGGAKTVKVMALERIFLARYRKASQAEERYLALNATISQIPRNAIEALALGGVLLIVLFMLVRQGQDSSVTLATILPKLGLFALVGYRMLPGLQAIYQAIMTIRFAGNGLDRFFADMELSGQKSPLPQANLPRLKLARSFNLSDVTFRYNAGSATGLSSVSLAIPHGSRVGIVGTTGAGKTTLVDVMLGLLKPDSGRISVDGVIVDDENRTAWQANIGYVPQDIYLLDASIIENIAISAGSAPVDIERVRECLRLANLLDFVENELADGLNTGVGQRGVRLSGGQRQRIGIARALYRDPQFIVFDEATSALDTATERDVIDAIHNLAGEKTIVMVAHRLSTIRECNFIVVMEHGRLKASGTYAELVGRGIIHDV